MIKETNLAYKPLSMKVTEEGGSNNDCVRHVMDDSYLVLGDEDYRMMMTVEMVVTEVRVEKGPASCHGQTGVSET